MDVGRYCNRQVITAEAQVAVQEAAQLMREYHVDDIVIVRPTWAC